MMASSSRRKPVRRDLLTELENSIGNVSMKEWVRKSFHSDGMSSTQLKTMVSDGTISPLPRETRNQVPVASWYRRTEEEARLANQRGVLTTNQEEVRRARGLSETTHPSEMGVGEDSQAARVSQTTTRKELLGCGPDTSFNKDGPSVGGLQEAHEDVSVDEGKLMMGLTAVGLVSPASPTDMISPLREFLGREARVLTAYDTEEKSGGKRSRRSEKSFSKALGVRKKIGRNPFQGNQIHKHAALVQLESEKVSPSLASIAHPSPSKTGPEKGECSEESTKPVVKEKPPVGA
ncbi:hypothetical protein AALP_AA6G125300 [Arabis alpina]|uniref:Uncharacterized protein n=1 Tax=Arabis alpina TaxID=50452 RepID=A0A087GNT5_ARAAL|nr:hypothetical protein AALP_AA6G125300 [Arabis alpina]